MVPNSRALASVPWTSCLRGELAGALCDSHAPEDPVLIPWGTGQPTLGNVSGQGTELACGRLAAATCFLSLQALSLAQYWPPAFRPSPDPQAPASPGPPLLSLGRGLW